MQQLQDRGIPLLSEDFLTDTKRDSLEAMISKHELVPTKSKVSEIIQFSKSYFAIFEKQSACNVKNKSSRTLIDTVYSESFSLCEIIVPRLVCCHHIYGCHISFLVTKYNAYTYACNKWRPTITKGSVIRKRGMQTSLHQTISMKYKHVT